MDMRTERAEPDSSNPLIAASDSDTLENCADVVELMGQLVTNSDGHHDPEAVELVLGTVVHALRVQAHRTGDRLRKAAPKTI